MRVREQDALILSGRLPKLRELISPLIDDLLDWFEIEDQKDRDVHHENLLGEILEQAAKNYVNFGRHQEPEYDFCTYFTYFCKEYLEDLQKKTREENFPAPTLSNMKRADNC